MFTPNAGDGQYPPSQLQRPILLRRGGRRLPVSNPAPWSNSFTVNLGSSIRHHHPPTVQRHYSNLRSGSSSETTVYTNSRRQLSHPVYPPPLHPRECQTPPPSNIPWPIPRYGIRRPRGGRGRYPGMHRRAACRAPARPDIVEKLMRYQRRESDAATFCKRAIESLVKKLQETPDELDSLLMAITTEGSQPTKCVKIQRTLDGRLQVDGRKGFPHITYSKIWRWPDLEKHQLQHLDSCQHGFDLQSPFVCVNPYHYERIHTGNKILETPNPVRDESPRTSPECDPLSTEEIPTGPVIPAPTSPVSKPVALLVPLATENYHVSEPHPMDVIHRRASTGPLIPPEHIKIEKGLYDDVVAHTVHFEHSNLEPAYPSHGPDSWSSWVSLPSNPGQAHKPGDGSHHYSQVPSEFVRRRISKELHHVHHFGISNVTVGPSLPKYWCSVAYFEMHTRVGDTFKGRYRFPQITIDGFVDPSAQDRFCLGALTNLKRTEQSKKARFHIGRGVQFEFRGEGDIWLRCLSDHSVFLQSSYLDSNSGRVPGDAVHKIYPGTHFKIFDFHHFHEEIQAKVLEAEADDEARAGLNPSSATLAKQESAGGALGIPPGKSSSLTAIQTANFDYLRRFCILRLSFVKGWGSEYSRQAIEETPCWVEIHLHRPLQLLDEYLRGAN